MLLLTMKLFQNSGLYFVYVPHLAKLTRHGSSFYFKTKTFLDNRFYACHFLQPMLKHVQTAFCTNGDQGQGRHRNGKTMLLLGAL